METKPYLIFSLHNVQYGIDANLVQEIFLLPELSPIAEAPDDIVGILNLRSKLVPVMHLDLRLRYRMQECKLSDSVIVLAWEGLQIGIIVNSVHEVRNITSEAIEQEISYGRVRESNARFIGGIAKVDANLIMLLNPEQLIRHSNTVEDLLAITNTDEQINEETNGNSTQQIDRETEFQLADTRRSFDSLKNKELLCNFYDLCCPNATPQERTIFRERAENLRRQSESSDFTGLVPLAVFGLNGEYFGLDLDVVREFTSVRNVTPIPCCPNHIIGNMNLRGEIVTLVDIRSVLNLSSNTANTTAKAIVIHVNEVVAGIPVDEVFDVMYLRPSDMTPVPVAVNSESDEYLKGTAPYLEKMLTVLDLPKILLKGRLALDEEI